MEQIIKDDLYRYIGKESESFKMQLRYFFFTPGFRYSFLWRLQDLVPYINLILLIRLR